MPVFNQWRGLIIYRIYIDTLLYKKSDLGFITPLKRNYVIICDDITDWTFYLNQIERERYPQKNVIHSARN